MADDDDQLPKQPISEDAIADSKGVVVVAENPSSEECKKQLQFSEDEETLIIRMHNLVGERWSLIAGRIPGRSAEEIERYWNSRQCSTSENLELFPKK